MQKGHCTHFSGHRIDTCCKYGKASWMIESGRRKRNRRVSGEVSRNSMVATDLRNLAIFRSELWTPSVSSNHKSFRTWGKSSKCKAPNSHKLCRQASRHNNTGKSGISYLLEVELEMRIDISLGASRVGSNTLIRRVLKRCVEHPRLQLLLFCLDRTPARVGSYRTLRRAHVQARCAEGRSSKAWCSTRCICWYFAVAGIKNCCWIVSATDRRRRW